MSNEDQDRFQVPDVPSPVCQQTVVGGEMLGTVHGEEEEGNKEKEDPKGERGDERWCSRSLPRLSTLGQQEELQDDTI